MSIFDIGFSIRNNEPLVKDFTTPVDSEFNTQEVPEDKTGTYKVKRGVGDFIMDLSKEGIIKTDNSELPLRDRFDYKRAIRDNVPSSKILDLISSSDNSFDFKQARVDLGDDKLLELLHKESDKNIMNHAISKVSSYTDFDKGTLKASMTINALTSDLLNMVGLIDDDAHAKDMSEITLIKQSLDESTHDKDFLSYSTLGNITGEVMSSPAVTTKAGLFAISAITGYGSGRADGDSVGVATMKGGLYGGTALLGAAAIEKVMDKIGTRANKNVYEYYKDMLNVNEAEANTIYNNWSKLNESTGKEYTDRLLSIMDNSGEIGARLKERAIKVNPSIKKDIDINKKDRIRYIKELVENDLDLTDLSRNLGEAADTIKSNYRKVKWKIKQDAGVEYNFMINMEDTLKKGELSIPENVGESVSDLVAVKDLFGITINKNKFKKGEQFALVEDLIDSVPHINSLINNSKGKNKNTWVKIKDLVERNIEEILPDEHLGLWKQVNKEYAGMKQVLDSELGDAIYRINRSTSKKPQIEVARAMEIIKATRNSGADTFTKLGNIVGGRDLEKLELSIIDSGFSNHLDDFSWKILDKSIRTNGFTSDKAKQISKLISDAKEVFRTDDIIRQIVSSNNSPTNMSTTLTGKLTVEVISRLFNSVMKYNPVGKLGKDLRMFDNLSDVLASPYKLRELGNTIHRIDGKTRDLIISRAIDNELYEDVVK